MTSPLARPSAAAGCRLPLTVAQHDLWIAAQMEPSGAAYNEPIVLAIQGACDETACRQAVRTLVQRHNALRLRFDGDGLAQTVAPVMHVPVRFADFRSLPPDAAQLALEEWSRGEVAAPFDLATGPLIRFGVAHVADDLHVLAMTCHHAVTDGWSQQILLSELEALYAAAVARRPFDLAQPEQINAFIEDELRRQAAAEFDEAQRYWTTLFADGFSPLVPPADGQAVPGRSGSGGARVAFSAAACGALEQLCRRERCSTFTALLTAFAVQLHRLTGSNDGVIGIHIAGQTGIANSYLVGYCVRTVPFRSQIDEAIEGTALLRATGDRLADALRHQIVPMRTILEAVHAPRPRHARPPVRVIFNMDRIPARPASAGVQASSKGRLGTAARFDLLWNVVAQPGGLAVECTYDAARFSSGRIANWLASYVAIVERLSTAPRSAVRDLWHALGTTAVA